MKKSLIIAMACYGLCAKAQVDTPRDFIYLFNDSLIEASRVRLRPDIFYSHINYDKQSINADKVKFFGNQYGVFANTKKLSRWEGSRFVEQVESGKINLYSRVYYDVSRFDSRIGHRDDTRYSPFEMYYNKGFGDLKSVNYQNLSQDMRDNAQSLDFLEAYKRQRGVGMVLAGVGVASCIAGIISFVSKSSEPLETGFSNFGMNRTTVNKHPNFGLSYALLGVGFGIGVTGSIKLFTARQKLNSAVDVYNQ